uniref:Ribonuclease L n=1 Tax=Salvator merianae TaxID=96440 RepID=A0A8D0DQA8_SALMN
MAADRAIQLNNAARDGAIEIVQQLLEEGTDVNSKVNDAGWTPLHSAVQSDEEEIVHLLLSKGANPLAKKANGATPFILAGITGNVKLLELFLDKQSDINEHDINGFTAFMEAAWYGKMEALQFLYNRGANVNLRREVDEEKKVMNKGGGTALMDAARHGHFKVVEVLIEEMKADVNICDNQDRNALVHALSVSEKKDCIPNKEQAAFFLLKCGADVNKRDESGKTTLILAAEMGSQGLVKAILKKDEVDIDDADKDSKTALMVAVEKENHEIVKMLCEAGAKKDIGSLTGAPSACYNNEIKKTLRQYGLWSSPSQQTVSYTASSIRWGPKLNDLHKMYRPMIGKLKIFIFPDFKIHRNSHGSVYLGFYDKKEVAVKVFPLDAENAEQEKNCLEQCCTSSHLIKILGWEKRKTCLYLCLNLCERNLEEYFGMAESENGTIESKDILKTIFQAVMEIHKFGFGHQDLEPSNILIDAAGKIFLADFDKSRKLVDDEEKDAIITKDLQALKGLVLYVVKRGKINFRDLPTQCPEDLENRREIEDLRTNLESPDENISVDQRLKKLICHPYFWNKNEKFSFLKDVGNESDIKTRNTKHHNSKSKILKVLNHDDDPFKEWKEQIDKEVLGSMTYPFHDGKNKKAKPKNPYDNCVTDLLKLIRNMDAHFSEKEDFNSMKIANRIKKPSSSLPYGHEEFCCP